jgi:hypothetical protein
MDIQRFLMAQVAFLEIQEDKQQAWDQIKKMPFKDIGMLNMEKTTVLDLVQ